MSFIKTDERHPSVVEKMISNQINTNSMYDIRIKMWNRKCKTQQNMSIALIAVAKKSYWQTTVCTVY